MTFARPGQGGAVAPPPLSCWGKVPFDRDYVRFNVDSDVGNWVVTTVFAAHEELCRRGGTIGPQREMRLLLAPPEFHGKAIALLVRRGEDQTGRAGPLTLYAEFDVAPLAAEWHLAALCCAPWWETFTRRVLAAPAVGEEAFASLLQGAAEPLDGIDLARRRFAAESRTPLKSPWLVLAGADPTQAIEVARRLVAGIDAVESGALRSLAVPVLPPAAGRARYDAAVRTAAWLRLVASLSERPGSPCAAVAEGWSGEGENGSS